MPQNTESFVRGFFIHLEVAGFRAASLHGWENGFSGELSDVDIVVSKDNYSCIVELVSHYANACGWRLHQVLRHETTAAFCVCARIDDPMQVVALDICSDYRRNERVLIRSEELLERRERLPWGGYRLRDAMELRYRFLKGALKTKRAEDFVPVFDSYPEVARREFEGWLKNTWGLVHSNWNADGLSRTWMDLERKSRKAPVENYYSHFRRVFTRLVWPTGLIVAGMNSAQNSVVSECFARLYFRGQIEVERFKISLFMPLVASTLIRCRSLGNGWKALISRDLWLAAEPEESPDVLVQRIATRLANRCAYRERLQDHQNGND